MPFGTRMSRQATWWTWWTWWTRDVSTLAHIAHISDPTVTRSSFIFFSPDLAGVPDPDLGLRFAHAIQTREWIASGSGQWTPVTKRVYPSPFDLQRGRGEAPSSQVFSLQRETALLSPSSRAHFSNSLEPRHQFFKSVSLNIPSHTTSSFPLEAATSKTLARFAPEQL